MSKAGITFGLESLIPLTAPTPAPITPPTMHPAMKLGKIDRHPTPAPTPSPISAPCAPPFPQPTATSVANASKADPGSRAPGHLYSDI